MSVILLINGELTEFQKWKFPGGEIGVKLNPLPERIGIINVMVTDTPSSEDIFVAMNLLDAIHKCKVNRSLVVLSFKYLPYARQDRVCHEGESFALEVFIRMILSMQHTFGQICMDDVHSSVANELFLKFKSEHLRIVNYPQNFFTEYLPEFDVIVAPDAGASFKASATQSDKMHIFLDKVRKNGKVLYEDYLHDSIMGSACIIDDICDGGATFISAAEMLRRTQPRMTSLSLYVTHGIFSKGIDILKEKFDNVYCSNPMTNAAYQATVIPF